MTSLTQNAISDNALKHVSDHRFVSLFVRLLHEFEVFCCVDARLICVGKSCFHWLIELLSHVDVFVKGKEKARKELVDVLLLRRLELFKDFGERAMETPQSQINGL